MGSGKTTAAINYMNKHTPNEERYLFITPYLSEVERILKSCNRTFYTPKTDNTKTSTKLSSLMSLMKQGCDIVSTHALFKKFNKDIIQLCKDMNYVLIMDEVTDVIQPFRVPPKDWEIATEKFIKKDENNRYKWIDNTYTFKNGKAFLDIKNMCDLGSLTSYKLKSEKEITLWSLPVDIFPSFKRVIVMTYMFDGQVQKAYYDSLNIKYSRLFLKGTCTDDLTFTPNPNHPQRYRVYHDYSKLIHVCEKTKLNQIGDKNGSLSKNWYETQKGSYLMTQLKNNIFNYFRNISHCKADELVWTTFRDYKADIQGKGYTKGFLACNTRSSNAYRNRTHVAYCINRFINLYIKMYFSQAYGDKIYFNEDAYALSEMLQFIWRSAIRDGKPINVYVPSKRMRGLLQTWIKQQTELYYEHQKSLVNTKNAE